MDYAGTTTTQKREVLADMVKGGAGEATGVIREEVRDGKRCFVFTQPNTGGSKFGLDTNVCDTYEHAYKLLHIGENLKDV